MPELSPTANAAARRLRETVATRIERSPRGGPMLLAAVVGLGAGLSDVGFSALVDLADWLFFDIIRDELLGGSRGAVVLLPALGGLLVAPITIMLVPAARGHSIPEVMVALDQRAGRLPAIGAVAKVVAAALTIGSGGSVGRQGPIVFLGSTIGSLLGRMLRLSEQNVRLLVAAGAAGGIAGTFNAPIAGVFFALEVLLRRFSTRNFSVVVLSSVVATVVAIQVRGDAPVFSVPQYELESALEIPLYALLGVICGVVAVVFIRALYWTEERFMELPRIPLLLTPALGGLMVGALALWDDGIFGREGAVDVALAGELAFGTLVLLLVLKLPATSTSIGSGGSGGVFFPSLFMGAMAGGAFGRVAHELLPGVTATAGAYGAVGMAALFAGSARAPITSVLILIELTDDFDLMVPLLTAVATATAVSQLLSRGTIYSFKAEHLGVVIDEQEQEPLDIMMQLRVSDAMAPVMHAFGPDTSLADITLAFEGDPDPMALVVTEDGEIHGLLTGFDVSQALAEGREDATAAEICSTELRTIYPEQSLHDALGIFASRGVRVLPVVERGAERRPVGLLRRTDITQAYAEGVERRVARTQRRRLAPVRRSDDVRYLDLRVTRESGLGGRMLSDIHLTPDAVIVAVRHDGATLIPRGNTRLSEGDRVTVIATASAVEEVRDTFQRGRPDA